MAQTGYTPISLYYSATASSVPVNTNLAAGELAINTNDGKLYYKDSSGVVQLLASKAGSSGSFGALSATSITNSGLTSGRVVYSTTGGLETDSANLTFNGTTLTANTLNLTNALGTVYGGTGVTTSTGSGNNVLSTSPTLVTPVLGTPTSVTLTNGTGLPLTTGVTGTLPIANGGTGVTTSTGSGNNVLSTSPTLVTPVLGTPTSGTLTNCTGLPNAGLVNSSVTVGSTAIALGATATTLAGLTSVTTSALTDSGLTSGRVTYASTGGLLADSVNLTFDGTNLGLAGGTANGVTYLNGSKVLTTGSALTFDGTNLGVGAGNINLGNAYFLNGRNTANTGYVPIVKVASGDILEFGSGGYNANFTGSVGIGTSSPGTKLQVVNSGSTDTRIGVGNVNTGFQIGVEATGACLLANFVAQPIYFATNGTERMRIDSSGNVGIGTSSPLGPLQIYTASGDCAIRLRNSVTGNLSGDGADITMSTGNDLYITNRENGTMRFEVNGSERMRIDSSGNLLVGLTSSTATPAQGIVLSMGSGSAGVYIGHANGTSSGNYYQAYSYNGSAIGSITQNGTTNVAYNTSSDYRLKENIQPMQNALATVAQLKPVTYKWKTDGSDGQGFIAHELQAVVPDCVTGDKDGLDDDGNPKYQGVDTSFLVATLTAALQETKALIDTQAETINALTARIVALETK
jgi:hypothetical protein